MHKDLQLIIYNPAQEATLALYNDTGCCGPHEQCCAVLIQRYYTIVCRSLWRSLLRIPSYLKVNGNIVGCSLTMCVWINPDMRQKERPVTFSKEKIFPVVTCLRPTRCWIITTVPRTAAAAQGCQSCFRCVLNVTLPNSKITLRRERSLGLLHHYL